jgi:hypothetical protein
VAILRACVAKSKAMDIRNFYGEKVTKARHEINDALIDLNDKERKEKEGSI